jgi:TetR/AcrR family transcriptional repressor of nem operon
MARAAAAIMTTADEIVAAAAALMWQQGYASTSVDEIIRESNVCKGSFYHHFGSKEALGLAVIDAWAGRLAAQVQAKIPPGAAGLEAVGAVLDAIVEIQRDNDYRGCLLGRMALEMADLSEAFRERIEASFNGLRAFLGGFLRQAGMAPGDAGEQADYLLATLEGALLFTKVARDGAVLERAVEKMKVELRRQLVETTA